MKPKGRRVAIRSGILAIAVTAALTICMEVFPFEVRYDVGDILMRIRDFPGIDTQSLAELIMEGCGGQEVIEVRANGKSVIAKGRLDRQVRVWRCLRNLRWL